MIFNFLEGEFLIYFWNKVEEGEGKTIPNPITKPPPPPNLLFPPARKGSASPCPCVPSLLRPELGFPAAVPAGSILGERDRWG